METFWLALFWCSTILLFHNYFGFGFTIRILAQFKPTRSIPADPELPTLTVLIPAHNEEANIGPTLDAVLAQGYPAEKFTVVVASDVSTDATNSIVEAYRERGVRLIAFIERHGKIGALDELIPQLKSEVVVILDSNVRLAPNALNRLAAVYTDPRVGAASGFQTVELPGQQTPLRDEVYYRRQEAKLKERLSRLGLLVGAFGGFYSIRRECFRPIGPIPMQDDVIVPMEPIAQGRQVVFQPEAVGYEEIGKHMGEEFTRRIRMTAYNLNAAGKMLRLAASGGITALYIVVSYKLLRWFSPYIGLVAMTAVFFLGSKSLFFGWLALLTGIILSLGVIGLILDRFQRRFALVSSICYFLLMNLASIIGLIGWIKGAQAWWQPPRAENSRAG